MTIRDDALVWRYMNFSHFLWLLQNNLLFLTNVCAFEDIWEMRLSVAQVNEAISQNTPQFTLEFVIENLKNNINKERQATFVNCWTVSENESYAFWKIYCHSSEGVAIQTTYKRLKESSPFEILEVNYEENNRNLSSIDWKSLVSQKRAAFEYEHEIRIVQKIPINEKAPKNSQTIGIAIPWEIENHIENVWIHPDAQFRFKDTVDDAVKLLAPKLMDKKDPRVKWSKLRDFPPLYTPSNLPS